jgi:anti-sigma B factor antagonist
MALEARRRIRSSAAVGGFAYLIGSRDCLLIRGNIRTGDFMPHIPVVRPPATRTQRVGRRAVVSVAGEVDISTADELRAAIETAGAEAFEIWVDLSATTFMDSSGLHVLANCHTRLANENRRLALICPASPVLRVLTLTGFDRLLEIYPSRNAANYAISA